MCHRFMLPQNVGPFAFRELEKLRESHGKGARSGV
jgi:hypothetical protein